MTRIKTQVIMPNRISRQKIRKAVNAVIKKRKGNKMKYKRYSKKTKERAFKAIKAGKSKLSIARDLNIGISTLYGWIKAQNGHSKPKKRTHKRKAVRKAVNAPDDMREIFKEAAKEILKESMAR